VRSFTYVKLSPPLLPRRLSFWDILSILKAFALTLKRSRSSKIGLCQSRNVHEVRSFLGLANYFRKFISHYSEVAAPLTNLTKKSHVWAWTGKCQDAFEKLKHLLTEAPLLRTPDESKTYRVVTDASDIGLGGILLQEGHPIAYESRKLNSAEQNYTNGKC
jgi:hypothetical protein